jgi:hypothetical protein
MTSAPGLKEMHIFDPNAARAWRRHAITIALVLGLSTPMIALFSAFRSDHRQRA